MCLPRTRGPLPNSFDDATSKQMPGRVPATALGIISILVHRAIILSAAKLRVQPVVVNVEERTCLYHPGTDGKEKEKVNLFRLRLKPCQAGNRQIHYVFCYKYIPKRKLILKRCKFVMALSFAKQMKQKNKIKPQKIEMNKKDKESANEREMENTKNGRCARERERGLVRDARGAIWVSKFNSAREKATEGHGEKRVRVRKSEDRVRGKCAEAQKAPAICCRRRSHSQNHSQK